MQGQPDIPGQEFLMPRLARARALPPEQRSPEVAAFVAGMEIDDQVPALLPLRPDGSAALPLHSAETEARVLLAHMCILGVLHALPWGLTMCHVLCGDRMLPYAPTFAGLLAAQLMSNSPGSSGSGQRPSSQQHPPALLMHCLLQAWGCLLQGDKQLEALEDASQALVQLSGEGRAAEVQHSLRHLEEQQRRLLPGAGPLVTVQQLRCLCQCLVLRATRDLCMDEQGDAPLPAGREREALARAEAAAAEALRLEPDNPKVHCLAAEAFLSFLSCSEP
ncbi:hypothetical protein ABPG75_003134 [Micractinium tetrahymenae]